MHKPKASGGGGSGGDQASACQAQSVKVGGGKRPKWSQWTGVCHRIKDLMGEQRVRLEYNAEGTVCWREVKRRAAVGIAPAAQEPSPKRTRKPASGKQKNARHTQIALGPRS